ncbi:MAG TPA: pyridoxamine 5'-phosphate oxidase family protein [Dongiaceae bacterium]|jgi:nitroimidazol reductase NimA-like FMN-containing flavoprotein (pyridoxamine 5'-phosphate oxidase superfamily)
MDKPVTDALGPTARTRVKRLPKRGHYDRAVVNEVLDAGFICHIGYVIDGQPYVTPTAYWREGTHVYWHGSSASRMLRAQTKGIPVCLTVTHLDGIVLARSAFHHSINYRSVMAFGTAHIVDDPKKKEAAMRAFVERVYPGRWDTLRPVNKQEFKATTILGMELTEASAKIRTGNPVDDDEDYALPIWAGVVGLKTVVAGIGDDGRLAPGTEMPGHLDAFAKDADFGALLKRYNGDS